NNCLVVNFATAVEESVSLTIANIKNPASQTTDPFFIETQDAADRAMDRGVVDGLTMIPGTITPAVVPATLEVSTAGNYAFTFTPAHSVEATGKVVIGFDADYDLSAVTANNISGNTGATLTVDDGPKTVTVNLGSAIVSSTTLTISNVKNPSYVQTTGVFLVQTKTAALDIIDQGTAPGVGIIAGALANISASAVSLEVSAVTDYTFNFTTDHALTAGSKVSIQFDTDYDLSAVAAANVTGNSGSTVSVSGNTLTVTLGESIGSTTAESLTISNIKNPAYVQSTDSIIITSRNPDGEAIDQGSIGGITTVAGSFATVSVADISSDKTGATLVQYTFNFIPLHNVAAGGTVRIDFDSDYNTGSAGVIFPSSDYTINTRGTNYVILNLINALEAGVAESLRLGNITNPAYAQSVTFTVSTYSALGKVDGGTSSSINILPSLMTNCSVTPSSYVATETSIHQIAFTAVNPLSSGDLVEVVFDSGYVLTGAAFVSGNSGATLSISSNTLIITLGTPISSLTPTTLVVSGIKNPGAKTTDYYLFTTKKSTGEVRDQNAQVPKNIIVAGALTNLSATSSMIEVSERIENSPYLTLNFTLAHELPVGGYIKIAFDTDYELQPDTFCVTNDYNLSKDDATRIIYLQRASSSVAAGATSIQLANIKNPSYVQTTGNFSITTELSSHYPIDIGSISGIGIVAGSLTSASINPASDVVSEFTTYTVNFINDHAIAAGSKVNIAFDSDYQFKLSGRYACVASMTDSSLTFMDISNPASPVLKSEISDETGGFSKLSGAQSVYVSGNYAYAVSSIDNSLTIVDISDPASPVLKSEIYDEAGGFTKLAGARSVYVSGNYAYVTASTDNSLTIVDISDPASPVLKAEITDGSGSFTKLAGARSVYVSGNYAYVTASTDNSLTIIDIANPASPVLKAEITDGSGSFTKLAGARSVYVSGNYAYVTASTDNSLTIIDIATPANPVLKSEVYDGDGEFNRLEGVESVYVSGNYAYVTASTDNSLTIIDIVTPANPVLKSEVYDGDGEFNRLAGAYSVYVSGNYAFVASSADSSLTIMDVTNPANPALKSEVYNGDGQFNKLSVPFTVFVYGDQVVSGNSGATVSASGSVLSVNLGTPVVANEAVSLQIENIRNPYYVQAPDAFQIQTKNSSGGVVDQNLSVSAVPIVKGIFSGLSVTAVDREISKSDNYTFVLTYGHPVPKDGYLRIDFDSEYDLSSAYLVTPTDRYTFLWDTGWSYVKLKLKEDIIANTSDTIVLGSVKNPSFVQQTSDHQFTTLSTDATANAVIDQSNLTGLIIIGGKLTGVSVSAANNVVTESSNYTINLTTKNPMSLNPSIKVAFDPDYDISEAVFVSGTVDGVSMVMQDPALTIDTVNNVATINLAMDVTNSTAAVSFILSGIGNPGYEQSAEFDITTQYGGNDIDITDPVAKPSVSIAAGVITSTSVTSASTEVSESGNYVFNFTLPHPLATGGFLKIQFDADYNLVNTNCQTGGFSLSKGADYIFLQRTGAQMTGAQSITLGNVKNPSYVQTTGNFVITTEDSGHHKIDGAEISGITTTTGALTSLSLTPLDYTVANTTAYNIAFTTDHAIVQNGKVEVTFDSDYVLTGVASGDVSGNSGSTVAVSGNKLTITLGTAVAGATSVSLQVANIVNPVYVKTTNSFAFRTMDAAGGLLDQGTASGVATVAGTFTAPSVTSTYYTTGKTDVSYTFNFTYAHNVPLDGFLRIDFDSDYDASSVAVAHANYTKQEAGANYVVLKLLVAKTKGTVESIALGNIKNPGYAQTVTFDIKSMNTTGSTIDTVTTPAINIVPAALTALSRSSNTYIATELATYTIGFTTVNAIPAGGKVEITFDSDYVLTSVASGNVSGNSGSTVAVSGNTLVVTLGTDIPALTAASLVISNIKNPGAQGTGNFSLLTKNASGYSIDQGAVSGVTITTGSLSGLSTAPVHTKVSYSTNYTFGFAVAHTVPVGGFIKIQFDSEYDLSSAFVVGDYTISKGANYVYLQRNVSALSGAVTVELRNIKNPAYVQTTDAFVITTELSNHDSIDVGNAPSIVTTAGTLTATSVTPATTVVAENTAYTLNFTTEHAIEAGSKVEVTFDPDCDLSLVFPGDVSGNEGAIVAVSDNKLIITLGEALEAGVSETLVISNITNPPYVKETSTFFVQTKNPTGGIVDEVAAASITTTTGTLGSPVITPASLVSGATTSYSFKFTPAHAVPLNGYLRIDFDSSYDLVSPGAVVMSSTTACDITLRGAGYLLIKFSSSGLSAGVQQTVEIANVVNPPNVKSLEFTLMTKDASLYDIDTVKVSGLSTTAGSLSSSSLTANTYVVSEYATYTAVFTTANPIAVGSRVELTFDTDYILSSIESTNVSGNNGSTVAVSGSKLIITIGTAVAKSTPVSLVITNIKNPVYVQATDSFLIQTKTADEAVIDTATATSINITTGALSGLSVASVSKKISDITSYTFNFTAQHAVPADGFIRIQFDSNYSLGSAYLDTASFYSLTKGSDYLRFKTVSAISAGQAVSIPISTIANPSYVYTVSNFQVKTMTTTQQIMDSGEITGVTLTPGSLSNISVIAASMEVSALTNYTFAFKTENSIAAATGKVAISLDSDYDLSAIEANNVSGNSGATVSVSGNSLSITLGTAVGAGESVSLVVSNIKNPSYVQTTGSVTLSTKVQINTVDYDKDGGSLAAGPAITSGDFTNVSIAATSQIAGEDSIYTFGFTPGHNVAAGGFIYIGFETGYDASGAYLTGSTGSGEYAVASLTSTQVVLNVTAGINSGEAQTISLGGVVNPPFVKDVICTVKSTNASAGIIDESDTPSFSITPAPLAVLSITGDSYVAQDLTSYTIAFTTVNPIDQNGMVEVEFDADYDLSVVQSGNVTGNSGSTVSVSGSKLIINLGTAVDSGEQVSLVVSNIKNPGVQTTGSFNLVTKNSSGSYLDYGGVTGTTITAGSLSGISVTPGTAEIGESTSYTFNLTLGHSVPTNGYVRVQFDDSYTLTNATVVTSGYSLTKGANYVLLKRTGSALSGAISIQLNSIVNPSYVSSALSGFAIQTQLSNNQVIDTGTTGAITTTAGALSTVTIIPVSLGVSTLTSYTFNFTTDHAIPSGGKFIVTFDSDYNLTSVQEG
ncbi:MAG: hypothetical protein WC306_03530, partial [Candidatus Paceibacterota bacterium]